MIRLRRGRQGSISWAFRIPVDGTTEGSETSAGTNVPADSASTVKSFEVSAANFAYSTKEIRVKKGDTVTINFQSTGGLHDWVVDEFEGARTDQVRPGTKTSATFTADKSGTFEFYCAVGDHRAMGMVGKLIVE